jgi:hypothetical protein
MPQNQPQSLPDTLPANFDFSTGQAPQTGQAPASQTPQPLPDTLPADYDFDKSGTPTQQTGEITNDVGQKVIVPKDGESFQDTMRRAVQYHQSLTPEQQKAAINAETATIPKKAAQTIAAAPAIGFGGTAALAATGEAIQGGIQAAKYAPEIAKAVLKHIQEPGQVFKFPYGRAIEYYMLTKLGLSTGAISKIASHIPVE